MEIRARIALMRQTEGLDIKACHATIAVAEMMYEEYLEKEDLKKSQQEYEKQMVDKEIKE